MTSPLHAHMIDRIRDHYVKEHDKLRCTGTIEECAPVQRGNKDKVEIHVWCPACQVRSDFTVGRAAAVKDGLIEL